MCASQKGGRNTFLPSLTPISVGDPFHHIVDILQLSATAQIKCYVAVFFYGVSNRSLHHSIPESRNYRKVVN